MAAYKGQPSPKPQSLSAPVPGADAQAEADAFLSSFDAPEVQAQAPADEAGQFMSGLEGEAPPAVPEAPAGPAPDQFAPEPGFAQANIEQFQPERFITRLQAGLAANETEKVAFLKKKYGDENVALKDGNIYYRKNPKEKLKVLDPGTFELISDIIPDFAREIVTEAALAPAEVAGAFAAGPAGAASGRVASIPFAQGAAETVAREAGVPQDPSRNLRTENMIGQAVEGLIPIAGAPLAKYAASKIPGTLAYKAAREVGDREAVALSKQSQEVLSAAKSLEEEGLQLNLMAHQVHPTSPQLEAAVSSVDKTGAFQAKQQEFAEGYGQLLKNTLNEITRRANPNGAVPEGRLATTITDAVEGLDKAEGKAIGQFRARALAQMRNKKVPLPEEVSQDMLKLMRELGFQPKQMTQKIVSRPGSIESTVARGGVSLPKEVTRTFWVPPKNLQPIIGRLGMDEGQTRAVVNVLNEYGQLISRGNEARLTDVERLISRMGPLNQKLSNSGVRGTWGRLTGEMRLHRRNLIKDNLADEIEGKAFDKVMDDFSMIRGNTEQLSNLLRGDVTSRSIVNGFFKGKENLANVRALKQITGKDSPEWGALKEEFISQLMAKHSKDGPTGFNSAGFLKDLQQNYGDDFIREVLDDGKAGPNYKTIKNMLTVGKRIEATQRGLKVDDLSEKQKAALTESLFGFVTGASYRLFNGTKKMLGIAGDRESTLMEILNRDGYEKYLAGYRGKDKGKIAENVEKLLADYTAMRQANKKVSDVLDVGKDILKRGTRATVREDLMRRD